MPAKSVSAKSLAAKAAVTSVRGKGPPAATTAMSKAVMSGEPVTTATVTGERVVAEAVMAAAGETVA